MKRTTADIFRKIIFTFLYVLFLLKLPAQICSGSLGDPVVNVTFGNGNNPGNPLPNNITNYNFTFSSCPVDGSYTIVNSSAGCFGNTWHTINQDHTATSSNGYMMLVNASVTPGDFYVDTVKSLCAGTTYEFGAWIMNVLLPSACNNNPIQPRLVFSIETTAGVVLGSYSTGDIAAAATPVWKQYGLFFTTPAGNSNIVIRITNNAPGGCGNDLALDDITFRPCGPTVISKIISTGNPSIDLCDKNVLPVSITASISSGYILPSLQWQESMDNAASWTDIAGAVNNNFIFSKTAIGNYQYRLSVAEGNNIGISNCRVASNPVIINIRQLPIANATNNSPVCENGIIELSATNGISYNWTGPNNFTASAAKTQLIATSAAAGNYSVVVTDAYGCKDSTSTTVFLNPKPIAGISADKTICLGDTVQLNSNGGTTYFWFPADNISNINSQNPFAVPVENIIYNVVVTNAENCTDTASVKITVNKSPIANAGADKFIFKGEKIILEGVATGNDISYFWTPVDFLNDPGLEKPTTSILHDTTYTFHVVSNTGCGVATDDVFVKVFNGLFIPNAFSPNNDGRNETWRIETLYLFPKAVLAVYNRYGLKVFESTGNNKTWDGTYKGQLAASGVYVYYLNLKNGKPIIKGTVILIR